MRGPERPGPRRDHRAPQRRRGWRRLLPAALLLGAALATSRPALAQTQPTGVPPTEVASYRIEARLEPAARQISGVEEITYRNPSSETLREVWLHLYLNAFRSADTVWMREAGQEHRGAVFDPAHPGWIRLEALWLAGSGAPLPVPAGSEAEATIIRVPLPEPLPSGGMLALGARWTAQLPRIFARTGFAGDFFMLGQWYPKLAVFDRGQWDSEPWHANAEFFHDFGSYELAVTVPASYATGASGVRVAETLNPDGTKTVRYRAAPVTDVAWTAWPDFAVVDRTVEAAGATVELELLLPPSELPAAERHLAAAQLALDRYGRWFGPYPWPKLTIVVPPPGADAAGGMEYPQLVTTTRAPDLPLGLASGLHLLEIVTAHEIAHQWFPMQVQSNEAREAWLDEGLAEYASTRLLRERYGEGRTLLDLPFGRLGLDAIHRASFLMHATREPLAQPSWRLTPAAYAATVYAKGSLVLLTLERTLGSERFTRALRGYVDRWRWGHPTSADLQAALEAATGQPLDEFFRAFVEGSAVVDYRIGELRSGRISIERRGEASIPVQIRLTFADGSHRTESWDGRASQLTLAVGDGLAAVEVDPEARVALELDRLDNTRVLAPSWEGPLALASRWLSLVQLLLQLLGQIG